MEGIIVKRIIDKETIELSGDNFSVGDILTTDKFKTMDAPHVVENLGNGVYKMKGSIHSFDKPGKPVYRAGWKSGESVDVFKGATPGYFISVTQAPAGAL